MAKIIANGNVVEIQQPYRLSEWLQRAGWKPTQVVVELNGEVVQKSRVNDIELHDGDRLEVILPVAGG
ncbi:MAG: sulfur carrier protein ThiS [Verrucomicrobiota bacterium]|jgi:thiamine biosynthesis protein ThiS